MTNATGMEARKVSATAVLRALDTGQQSRRRVLVQQPLPFDDAVLQQHHATRRCGLDQCVEAEPVGEVGVRSRPRPRRAPGWRTGVSTIMSSQYVLTERSRAVTSVT